MKVPALVAALALVSACTTNGGAAAGDAGPAMRVAAETGYATTERSDAVIVTDEATYRRTWERLIGNGEPPAIDFTTESAVFLFGGARPTGGYSIDVRGVSVENGTLIVDGGVQSPPAGSMTTQSITYPTMVIAVKTRDLKDVRWTP